MVNFDNFGGLKSVLKFHKCEEKLPIPHTCEEEVISTQISQM